MISFKFRLLKKACVEVVKERGLLGAVLRQTNVAHGPRDIGC
jgi:hypothetical protein